MTEKKNLVYDKQLGCYYDPHTGEYFEYQARPSNQWG